LQPRPPPATDFTEEKVIRISAATEEFIGYFLGRVRFYGHVAVLDRVVLDHFPV
jgi:hypothetical protein